MGSLEGRVQVRLRAGVIKTLTPTLPYSPNPNLQTAFERSPLLSGVQRQGCLRRGGAEVLTLTLTLT